MAEAPVASRHVVVVGGGITGLAAAYRLSRLAAGAGGRPVTITVLEAGRRWGGKIVTDAVDGFLVEGGADTMLARKAPGLALSREVGLADRVIPTDPANRGASVWRRGRLHPLPEGMSGLVPGRLRPLFASSLLSARGRLRAAAEPFVPTAANGAEETVAQFTERRFGREMYDRLLEPLLCGIYAGDGARLSAAATAPSLVALERRYGSVLRGVRRGGDGHGTGPTGFVSFRGGMQELVDTLRRRSPGVSYRRGAAVRELSLIGREVAVALGGETLRAAAVVLAVPAWEAAGLLEGIEPRAAALARSVPFVSTATVSLGYRRQGLGHPLRGYGYVIPRDQRRDALACSWSSSKLPGRAPEGCVLVRAYFGREGQRVDAVDDEALVAMARAEVGETLGERQAPVLARTYRFPMAMPQYTVGHLDRVAGLERALEATRRLVVAGGSYHGVGIPDCIASADRAANAAWRLLEPEGRG